MIETAETLRELRTARSLLVEPVGLVPTMGFLHEGHLSLVQQARRECQSVVATIFVNPTQFGPLEDLESYPRNIPRDLELLDSAGCNLVWLPTPEIMYPEDYQTWVMVDQVSRLLEGEQRPGHFRGVATIVTKLFNSVQPQKAYFGQKDAQQVVVIQQMTRDLNFPVEIIVGPTIRETDGLAMSSRNSYLNGDERNAATVLYRALCTAKDAFSKGEQRTDYLKQAIKEIIAQEPMARIQYIEISDPVTLNSLDTVNQDALFSMAVFIGKTRLIDNFLLQAGSWQTGKIAWS
jgi:pantoate--beta-alanine ligase